MTEPMQDVFTSAITTWMTPAQIRDKREVAILMGRVSSVRLWLDRSAAEPRVIVEDLERDEFASVSAEDLAALIHGG